MGVWMTSDLHLGHRLAARLRGFDSVESHDNAIITNIQTHLRNKDKLFVLGDVAFSLDGLNRMREVTCQKEFLFGNHDLKHARIYLEVFNKIHGFKKYKNFWLSHCPIHPQEMFRCRGNIHGHIHNGGLTGNIGMPYFNVNTDVNNYHPVSFDFIVDRFDAWGKTA